MMASEPVPQQFDAAAVADDVRNLFRRVAIDAGHIHRDTIEAAKQLCKSLDAAGDAAGMAHVVAAIKRACGRIEYEGLPFPLRCTEEKIARHNAKRGGRPFPELPTADYLRGLADELAHEQKTFSDDVSSQAGVGAGDDPSIPSQGFTPGALAELLDVNDKTISRNAKTAGVERPRPGEKAKPYPLCDVQRILLQFVSGSRRDSTKAADLLNRVNKAMAQRSPTKAGQGRH